MSIESQAERKEHDRTQSGTCLKETQSHTNRLKWEKGLCVSGWGCSLQSKGQLKKLRSNIKLGAQEFEGQ